MRCGVGFSLRIRLMTRLGVARAASPDVRYGHPARRSLGGNLAFAILAALGFLRRLRGTGNPGADTVARGKCLVVSDNIVAVPRGKGVVGVDVDCLLDELYRTVAEEVICSTRMLA